MPFSQVIISVGGANQRPIFGLRAGRYDIASNNRVEEIAVVGDVVARVDVFNVFFGGGFEVQGNNHLVFIGLREPVLKCRQNCGKINSEHEGVPFLFHAAGRS